MAGYKVSESQLAFQMAQRGARHKVLDFSATLYVVYLIGAQ